jgi:hypothetical protein
MKYSVIGCSGMNDESFGLEKNTKGSIKKHVHAAILIMSWAIFFFKIVYVNLVKAIRVKNDYAEN